MADKKQRDWNKQEDLPQFNYRHPGEPETFGMESKETPRGEKRGKAVMDRVEREEERSKEARETELDEGGLSPHRGGSPPQTQKQLDDENTWSGPR